ncbi:MAG: SDR family NAD(P)-dependent oxidoreductase, partial [Actinomycetes bacterium]
MSRVVLVTGASRGIGAATAEAFIERGDTVIAISRSGTAPQGTAKSFALDVADAAALKSAVDEIVDEFGPIEV